MAGVRCQYPKPFDQQDFWPELCVCFLFFLTKTRFLASIAKHTHALLLLVAVELQNIFTGLLVSLLPCKNWQREFQRCWQIFLDNQSPTAVSVRCEASVGTAIGKLLNKKQGTTPFAFLAQILHWPHVFCLLSPPIILWKRDLFYRVYCLQGSPETNLFHTMNSTVYDYVITKFFVTKNKPGGGTEHFPV